jgi:hypothetical protein
VVVKAPTPDPGIKMLQDYIAAQEKARADKIAQKQKDKDDAAAAAAAAAKKAEEDKLDALQKLILEHNKAQLEREKQRLEEWEAERKKKEDAEKAAAEAKRIQAEKDKEIKAAAERATLEAEKKAAEEAAKKKEEYDKEMEEIKKKQAELEEAKKKAEAEAKQLRPGDDMKKAPIRFKDAVGRKFSFPWHLCKTWKVSRCNPKSHTTSHAHDSTGNGHSYPASFPPHRCYWPTRPRWSLRSDWSRWRDHPATGLGDNDQARHLH